MKKLLFLLCLVLTSCGCLLSQIPPQTIYANTNCEGLLPDYRTKVVASDNCVGQVTITQNPVPGTVLTVNNPAVTVTLVAKDAFGNTSKPLNVSVILVDTVPPILSWPVGQVNMNDRDAVNLYKNWEAAVKVHGMAKWLYDMRWTQGLPLADTTRILDSMHYFTNVIYLTDEEYAQYVSYVESNK